MDTNKTRIENLNGKLKTLHLFAVTRFNSCSFVSIRG
jgi:hypothetical protein